MGSGSPTSPRASAIPSHMLNGSSPLQRSTSSRDSRERESLNTSIRSSFEPRIPLEFESPNTETKTETEGDNETGATPAQSVSSASVPIRSVAPVRYVYSNINISDPGALHFFSNLRAVVLA
jgi:GTP cyclohydrolase I